jgi:hypothetical protein
MLGDKMILRPDCVIALAFGYRRTHGKIIPGPSNEALAEVVHEKYSGLPKILQFEVADAFAKHDNEPILRIEQHRTGAYMDTREVLVQASELCKKSGWETAALVAHPSHLPRVRACAEKLGLRVSTDQIDEMQGLDIPYDPQSDQSWTRSRWRMQLHEVLANGLYKALGHI